jgi:hypothetical protein
LLETWREGLPEGLEPLARAAGRNRASQRNRVSADVPDAWKVRTFRDQGFRYLWNVSHTSAVDTWLGDKPDRVKFPYNIIDQPTREEFEKKYGGRDDVPIYSDPRVAPTFHGVGAGVFATDPATERSTPRDSSSPAGSTLIPTAPGR